jgi:hypothetical protein
MDILTIIVLSACVLIPFSAIMAVVAVFSYQAKLGSAIKYLKSYKDSQLTKQIDAKPSVKLTFFIIFALTIIGSLGCLIVIIIGRYLGIALYP